MSIEEHPDVAPWLAPRDVHKAMTALGFAVEDTSGGHYAWTRADATRTIVVTDETCGADLSCHEVMVGYYLAGDIDPEEGWTTADADAWHTFDDVSVAIPFLVREHSPEGSGQ